MKLFGFKEFQNSPYYIGNFGGLSGASSPLGLSTKVNYTKARVQSFSVIGKLLLLFCVIVQEFAAISGVGIFTVMGVLFFKEKDLSLMLGGLLALLFGVLILILACRMIPRLIFTAKVLFEPRVESDG